MACASKAQLSCQELAELVVSLDDLYVTLENVDSIGINSPLDNALGDLSEALNAVAEVEEDRRLTRMIADLNYAWDSMEREDFEDALDDIINRMDEMGERDCN